MREFLGIIAALIMFTIFKESLNQDGASAELFGLVFGSLVMGALLGAIPMMAARSRGKKNLAVIAMGSTMLGSFLLGLLLSVPLAIIFTVVALLESEKKDMT